MRSKKSSPLDLVVIGHLLKEKIIFPDGEETDSVLGSPAAYASVASAKLGLKTGLVTKIGNDMPEELLKVFEEAGVDTDGIRIGNNTTTNRLIYEKSGKKRLEFLKKADDISFEDIPHKYLDAQFFLIAPIDYEVPENLIKFLHGKCKRLSMELSGFGGASSSKDGKFAKGERINLLERITQYFEIVKGGQEDYCCLFGDVDERKTGKKFIEWGAKISIVTLGGEGALVMNRENFLKIPCFPAEVVDCTGAGDVWHAGFLVEYMRKEDLYKSGLFASASSSILIEKSGGVTAFRMPTVEKVNQKLDNRGCKL